jgi:hypothetical protein
MAEPVAVAYVMPWWMQWGQAVGVAAISGLGAWIAYKQVRIASAKLNLDLYDRRFKVFEAARGFVGKFLIDGAFTPEEITKFSAGVSDAVFLFDGEVKSYLDGLREKAFALRKMNRQAKVATDENIEKIVDDMAKIEDEMLEEIPRLIEVFKPYLKLGNI